MTRKDFELIARVVKSQECEATHRDLAQAFASALAPTNPRFNRARFIAACGV